MAALRGVIEAARHAAATAWCFVRDRRNLHLTAPMLSLPLAALLILRSRRPVIVRTMSMAALLRLLEVRLARVRRWTDCGESLLTRRCWMCESCRQIAWRLSIPRLGPGTWSCLAPRMVLDRPQQQQAQQHRQQQQAQRRPPAHPA